jgi:predicted nuclease of predicted toxin-antitoxin system
MKIKVLIDMNLSPLWKGVFERNGITALHWCDIGEKTATDQALMAWASEHGYIVFTHDLDFGAILAATQAAGPSVLQIRVQDILPQSHETFLIEILRQYEPTLLSGALIVVDKLKQRVRILPINRS